MERYGFGIRTLCTPDIKRVLLEIADDGVWPRTAPFLKRKRAGICWASEAARVVQSAPTHLVSLVSRRGAVVGAFRARCCEVDALPGWRRLGDVASSGSYGHAGLGCPSERKNLGSSSRTAQPQNSNLRSKTTEPVGTTCAEALRHCQKGLFSSSPQTASALFSNRRRIPSSRVKGPQLNADCAEVALSRFLVASGISRVATMRWRIPHFGDVLHRKTEEGTR